MMGTQNTTALGVRFSISAMAAHRKDKRGRSGSAGVSTACHSVVYDGRKKPRHLVVPGHGTHDRKGIRVSNRYLQANGMRAVYSRKCVEREQRHFSLTPSA